MAVDQSRDPDELARLLRQGVKSTVARWVLQRRNRGGAPIPGTRDEGTHRWDGRRRFAEDYSFGVVQPGTALVLRTEWLAGREAHRVWAVLLTREGAWITPLMAEGQGLVRGKHQPWSVGGLELDCARPHVRWGIRFAGELVRASGEGLPRRASIDLTFEATSDPFVPGTHDDPELVARNLGEAAWSRRLIRSLRQGASRGYVQPGEAHGTVALGAEMIPIRATVIRSHSWGVRDWGASDEAVQGIVALADGRRAWVHRAEFPWMTLEGGFVLEPGAPRLQPVRSLGLTRESVGGQIATRIGVHLDHGPAGAVPPTRQLTTEGQLVSSTSVALDGRGQVDLSLLDLPKGGGGLWARQQRTLPRPPLRP